MSDTPPDTHRGFLDLVEALSMLSPEAARELTDEAAARGISPSQLALQQGLLDAVQIDIVETLLHPEEVVPGYEILDVLGHGGMGVVYRARQKNLDRVVALKTVLVSRMTDAAAVSRFEQEALAVARLRHPNVVAAYDFGRHAGRLFFAMELVEGEDIEALIQRRGRLDESTAWGLARQAAAGLSHASQQGIVHRDIKPANLLLVDPPEGYPLPAGMPMVKIADFGLAFLTTEAETRTRLTAANRTVGSPHYIAPELLSGTQADLRADIYSLGATVYHMLAGQPPFAGLSLTQIITQKISEDFHPTPDALPGASVESTQLVVQMMARYPEQRIGSYAELLSRIAKLTSMRTAEWSPAAPPPTAETITGLHTVTSPDAMGERSAPPEPSARGNLRWLALLILVTAAVAAGIGWMFFGSNQADPPRHDMVPSGWGEWLFSGQSLDGWKARSGNWTSLEHEDYGGVISGADGIFARSLPRPSGRALTNFRLTALVMLHQASAVEFHFGIVATPNSDGPRYVLRVTPEGVVLGKRTSDAGTFSPLAELPSLTIEADRLLAVRLERQYGHWWVFIEGNEGKREQLVGTVPVSAARELAEFRLAAEGEDRPAYFSDVRIEKLEPPKESEGTKTSDRRQKPIRQAG